MLKMIDVLAQNLVQNFNHALSTPSEQLDELLNQGILNTSEDQLRNAMAAFLIVKMR